MFQGVDRPVEIGKAMVARGKTPDEVCAWLHEDGLSIIDCVKSIVMIYSVRLGAAKTFVESRPYHRHRNRQDAEARQEVLDAVRQEGPVYERAMSVEEREAYYPSVLYPERDLTSELATE